MLKVFATGRITDDPQNSVSQSGTTIERFTIAVDRRRPDADGNRVTDFHRCVCFGKTAEFVDRYFSKGQRINLEGELQNNNYTDSNGTKHYGEVIVVNEVEFGESKRDGQQNTPAPQNSQAAPMNDGFMGIPDGVDDMGLPFS